MKVYVVEAAIYEDRYIAGIFSSVDKAVTANPVPDRPVDTSEHSAARVCGWLCDPDDHVWDNGLDGDDARRINEFTVDEYVSERT